MLDLSNARVLIFGGGKVGVRKASFFAGEAKVLVVSQKFAKEFDLLGVARIEAEAGDALDLIDSADIVIAATNDADLNKRITERAERLSKLYNSTDCGGNFMIPSVVKKENYLIAISTMGSSPAMAKYMRLKLDSELDEAYSAMVKLQQELRTSARKSLKKQREREAFLWQILNDQDVWNALKQDYSKARELALKKMGV